MDQHHVNPSLNPSLHLHIDWDCEMLKILGLSFYRYHRYLTCSCGSFLPLNKLVHHYKKDHSDILHDQLKIYANKEFIPLIEHFATSFDILCDQTAVNFTWWSGPLLRMACTSQPFHWKCSLFMIFSLGETSDLHMSHK